MQAIRQRHDIATGIAQQLSRLKTRVPVSNSCHLPEARCNCTPAYLRGHFDGRGLSAEEMTRKWD